MGVHRAGTESNALLATPVVANGHVFVGSYNDSLYAVQA